MALEDLPPPTRYAFPTGPLRAHQRAFGYTQEDLASSWGRWPRRRRAGRLDGQRHPLAVLSDQNPPLFNYFKQLFAQVTNPPIDPIREEIVMSLATSLGSERNLFDETPEHAHKLAQTAILSTGSSRSCGTRPRRRRAHDRHHFALDGPRGDGRRAEHICREAQEAISGVNVIVLSDRASGRAAPIPSLLAVAAVHHHLVREGTRLRAGLILESGEPHEEHHFAC